MRLLTPERVYTEELLDAGAGNDDDVAANLADLRRLNGVLGGSRVILGALNELTYGSACENLSLLDVGTGSADIPAKAVAWCKAKRIRPRIVGLDLSERNLRVTREHLSVRPEVSLVRGDALRLPFRRRSFDFVSASLLLHHFREADIVRLLAEFGRVARRAVIINDLVRNLVPYYFIRLTGPFITSSFLTRHDAPVSVLRGFTSHELRELAWKAGLASSYVERVFPFRLRMICRPGNE
jgi:ubiquinone/menaquinone biosynthesis C-methylase UbiE